MRVPAHCILPYRTVKSHLRRGSAPSQSLRLTWRVVADSARCILLLIPPWRRAPRRRLIITQLRRTTGRQP